MTDETGRAAVVPVAIGGCFALYQWAPGGAALILPPLGGEAGATARVWRELSLRLAARGIASLRPDLPGTGDSAGDCEARDILDVWRGAVRECAAWLAARHGGRVTLIGCRFGALLGLDVLASGVPEGVTVERVALLAPPASGATYARELRVRARLEGRGPLAERPGITSVAGLLLPEAGLDDIARRPRRPAAPATMPPVTVFSAEKLDVPRGWLRDWQEAGVAVETRPFPGHDSFLQCVPMDMRTPEALLDSVAALPEPGPACALPPPVPSGLALPEGREEPIWFGTAPRRFGLLCRPLHARDDMPAVVLPSVANVPRSGGDRGWTVLARRLAALGVTSLRFDQAGVGESEGDSGTDLMVEAYRGEHTAGVSAAVTALHERGFQRVVVIGLCSGAYQAWHAAAQDPRIAGIMVVNPQHLARVTSFRREALETLSVTSPKVTPKWAVTELRHHLSRIRHGKEGPGVLLRTVASFAVRSVREAAGATLRRLGWQGRQAAQMRRHLDRLLARGCAVRFVFAEGDDGLKGFEGFFGAPPVLPPDAVLTLVPGADHLFAPGPLQDRLVGMATGFATATAETKAAGWRPDQRAPGVSHGQSAQASLAMMADPVRG